MTPKQEKLLQETLQAIGKIGDEMFADVGRPLNAREYRAAAEVYRAILARGTADILRDQLEKLTYETTYLRNAITGIASQILGTLSAKGREPV